MKGYKKVNSISYNIKNMPISKKLIFIEIFMSLSALKPHS